MAGRARGIGARHGRLLACDRRQLHRPQAPAARAPGARPRGGCCANPFRAGGDRRRAGAGHLLAARGAAAGAGRGGGLERGAGLRAHHGRAPLPGRVGGARCRRRVAGGSPAGRDAVDPRAGRRLARASPVAARPLRGVAARVGGAHRRARDGPMPHAASRSSATCAAATGSCSSACTTSCTSSSFIASRARMPERPAPLVLVTTPREGQAFGSHSAIAAAGQALLASRAVAPSREARRGGCAIGLG